MQSKNIHTISGSKTVWEAARMMAELNIGALVVGTPQKIAGLFTERDILNKVVGNNLSLESTKIKDVKSTNIMFVEDNEMVYVALKIMQEKKFRHLPVVNEKGLCVGMVSIRDLMKAISEIFEKENNGLVSYIAGLSLS